MTAKPAEFHNSFSTMTWPYQFAIVLGRPHLIQNNLYVRGNVNMCTTYIWYASRFDTKALHVIILKLLFLKLHKAYSISKKFLDNDQNWNGNQMFEFWSDLNKLIKYSQRFGFPAIEQLDASCLSSKITFLKFKTLLSNLSFYVR